MTRPAFVFFAVLVGSMPACGAEVVTEPIRAGTSDADTEGGPGTSDAGTTGGPGSSDETTTTGASTLDGGASGCQYQDCAVGRSCCAGLVCTPASISGQNLWLCLPACSTVGMACATQFGAFCCAGMVCNQPDPLASGICEPA